MTAFSVAVGGSFRDPASRVYVAGNRVLRGINEETAKNLDALTEAPFYRELVKDGLVVTTAPADVCDPEVHGILADGWTKAIEHDRIPVITYPYEWTFSMLRDAALLTLDILERAIREGWILKDATPFNVQFVGSRPIFIDTPSFVPRQTGEHWRAYRQFCMLFLYPLMLKAHAGIDFNGLLRADLDGVTPIQAARYFRGLNRLKRGVLSHVTLPAWIESSIERKERDRAAVRQRASRPQSEVLVLALVQSMRRLISNLRYRVSHTAWSEYDRTHSYDEIEFLAKREFVTEAASHNRTQISWDLGCNTGTFARIAAGFSANVIAADSDHDALEKLYLEERKSNDRKITPTYVNVANLSPNQGWAGRERDAFDARNKPQLVICLALIHHIVLSSNIPIPMFLAWLRTLNARIIIEFVDRQDEMVVKLLTNKSEKYSAYNLKNFELELAKLFKPIRKLDLKGEARKLYYCEPV